MLCNYQQDKKTLSPPLGLVIFADVIECSLYISDSPLVIKPVKKARQELENVIFLKTEVSNLLKWSFITT